MPSSSNDTLRRLSIDWKPLISEPMTGKKPSATDAKPPGEPRDKSVGIWIRVSTEDQAKGESPKHHEARARMYAEVKGWEVVTLYDLSGVSGKTVREHPEAQRMLEDVERGRVTGLIFSKLARLGRNTRELLDFAEFFQEHDADLISLQESIDTSTPAGRLFYTVIAAMAQWEREEISDRLKASVVVRGQLGKSTGGAAPFGYKWENKQLVLDPEEAPIRRLLYELFTQEHGRIRAIARRLNEMGHRTRKGTAFSDTTVRRLLTDPIAKGMRCVNSTKSLGQGKRWKRKSEDEWIRVDVPAIVSTEVFDEINAELAERVRKRKARPSKKTRHLFAGTVLCGACERAMYVLSGSPKYTCQTCRRKIPSDDLERVFREQLQGFWLSEDDVAEHLAQADDVLNEKQQLLEAGERERRKLQAEMEKVYRLYQDDQISSEGFGQRYRPMEERLHQLAEALPRLQGEIDFLKIAHLNSSDIISNAQDVYARWDDLTFEEKRRLVETLVQEIQIGEGDISFELNYMPEPSIEFPELEKTPHPSSSPTATKRQRNSMDSSKRAARSGPGM